MAIPRKSVSRYFVPITSAAVYAGSRATFSVLRNTITSWLKKAAMLLELQETLCEPDSAAAVALELDELWPFVLKRANICSQR